MRSVPVICGWETRPLCISCMTIRPPFACTASATDRQAAICSSVTMPGWPGYARDSWLGYVPSVTIIPTLARCA